MSTKNNDSENATTSSTNDNDAFNVLIAMGFLPLQVRTALQITNGNVDSAANYLLSESHDVSVDTYDDHYSHPNDDREYSSRHGNTSSRTEFIEQHSNSFTTATAPSASVRTTSESDVSSTTSTAAAAAAAVGVQQIHGTTSQYNYENGRSACTFIALTTAAHLLRQDSTVAMTNPTNQEGCIVKEITINASFVDDMIRQGCTAYTEYIQQEQQQQQQSSGISTATTVVEHTSVEEVLRMRYDPYRQLQLLPCGIRQGILSQRNYILLSHLTECQSDIEWICVIMIKPPETILLFLPPKTATTATTNTQPNTTSSSSSSSNQHKYYYLFDSHPRRNEFQSEYAYCRIHTSLHDLLQSIHAIFPPNTDLGPDVPEYMSAMYNSYDLYPLHWSLV
jgi:UBA/TS-N domain